MPRMKTFRWLWHHRTVRTIAGALLAGVSLPVLVGLVLKALGLHHGVSLHTWLLDVQQNLGSGGALGGFGAGAAGAGGPVPPKDNDPDPCEVAKRAVLADQGNVDVIKQELNLKEAQISALEAPFQQLQKQATALSSQANLELLEQFAITAITKLIQGLMVAMGDPEFAPGTLGGAGAASTVNSVNAAIKTVTNPAGQVSGSTIGGQYAAGVPGAASFWMQMYQYFQASQGDLNAVAQLANANNLPAAKEFVDVMNQMNQLVNQGCALANALPQLQEKLDDAQAQLKQDQQDLANCEAGNSGNGSSGGDS
jgi:hypothetical protein